MAREKKCNCEKGAPAWVVTFSDLMSLLLTFFILLLSFATMEEPKRYSETLIAIQGAFGVMPHELTMVQINPLPTPMNKKNKKEEEIAIKVRRQLQVSTRAAEDIAVKYDEAGGLKISLPAALLYPPGTSELRPGAYPVLNDLASVLAELPEAFFEIRGHTDNSPMGEGSPYRDNYDLSYARADVVVRYFNRLGRIPLEQFEIVACGASQPVAPNTTPEGRAANRRVDLYVRSLLTKSEVSELRQRVRSLTNL